MWTKHYSSPLDNSGRGVKKVNIWRRKQGTMVLMMWSLVFFVLFVPKQNCDGQPQQNVNLPMTRAVVLNKCCPDGTKYDDASSECVQIFSGVSSSSLKDDDEREVSQNSSPNTYKIHNDSDTFLSSVLNLPKELLLFIPKQDANSSAHSFQFKLEHNSDAAKCVNGNFTVQIKLSSIISSNNNNNTNSQNDNNADSGYKVLFEDDGSTQLFSLVSVPLFTVSGHLRIQKKKEIFGVNSTEYFSAPEYCIAGLTDDVLTIRVCNPTCTGNTPCIRKCCDMDQVWNQSRGDKQKCSSAGPAQWIPPFYKDIGTKATASEVAAIHPHYTIAHPKSWCKVTAYPYYTIDQQDETGKSRIKFRILTSGGVFTKINRYDWNTTESDPMFYCIDGRINPKHLPSSLPNQTDYSGDHEYDSVVFSCGPEAPTEDRRTQTTLYGIAMIFSCFFLLVMIAVYILLFEKQRVHGWTIMSYATSLFCMYLCFVLMYFSNGQLVRKTSGRAGTYCYIIGVSLHFFFLSTFSWISMVNFDLWSTFRNLKPTSGRSKGLKRFLAYASFSFGVPIVIVSVALSLDSVYGDDFDSNVVVPEYARRTCQLDPVYAQLYYSYGPAGVLLIINLIFFTITVYSMYKIQQSTKIATDSSSKSQQQKQSMRLFAKLLFVMGIPWIFEIISWIVENGKKTAVPWYWVCFDLVNIFQAIAIFYIFVCKKDIIHSLEQKYPKFKNFLNAVLMKPEKADSIIKSYPKLKVFIKPFTRRQTDQTTTRTHTETSSIHYSSHHGQSVRRERDDFNMRSHPNV